MQLRELRLTGPAKKDAAIKFVAGPNVIAGASDTGKSYILRCMDYVLGAEEMTKRIEEAEGYELIYLEFADLQGNPLTLVRHLNGGDVRVHRTSIDTISDEGTTVVWKRQGKSTAADITSIFLPFAGMKEVRLRASAKGDTQRLTVRTLLPAFLVDEGSIIAERSPIFGDSGFDHTPRKRMLSYLLTGLDDSGIISAERRELAQAEARAKLALVGELLNPIEQRLKREGPFKQGEEQLTIERADEAIARLSNSLAEDRQERARLQAERSEALNAMQMAEAQIIALGELLKRYQLLDKRYESDLERLDFIAEGSHFFNQLQEARCPLCDQPMDAEHQHHLAGHADAAAVYESSRAEAAKILGLRTDLKEAISSLTARRSARESERSAAARKLDQIDQRVDRELAPALKSTKDRLDALIARRLQLEVIKSDTEQADSLRTVRAELEKDLAKPIAAPKDWASIDPTALHQFCAEIEALLKEWSWKGQARVEFDEKRCDIKVDGKQRQSHGKGIRAILHAAFVIGLLRFCTEKQRPHPGFVVLDSPLTTYKQGHADSVDDELDPSIEAAFWKSLGVVSSNIQIVVLDNKEPPADVASSLAYTWFGGKQARPEERKGFIPDLS